MDALTIGAAAAQTGWSSRMLRYLEDAGLVVPERVGSGYRAYGLRELRERHSLELDELAFAARLRREPGLRAAVDTWLHGSTPSADWVDWEQRKHERLLVA